MAMGTRSTAATTKTADNNTAPTAMEPPVDPEHAPGGHAAAISQSEHACAPEGEPEPAVPVVKPKAPAKGRKQAIPPVEGEDPGPPVKKRRGRQPGTKKAPGKKKAGDIDVFGTEVSANPINDAAPTLEAALVPEKDPLEGGAVPMPLEGTAAPTPLEGTAAQTPFEGATSQMPLEGAASQTQLEGAPAPVGQTGLAKPHTESSPELEGVDAFIRRPLRGLGGGRGGGHRGPRAEYNSMQALETYTVVIPETQLVGDPVIDGANRLHALQAAMSSVRLKASDVFKARGKILPHDWDNAQTRAIKTEIAKLLGLPTEMVGRQPRCTGPPLLSSSEPEDDTTGDGHAHASTAAASPIDESQPAAPPTAPDAAPTALPKARDAVPTRTVPPKGPDAAPDAPPAAPPTALPTAPDGAPAPAAPPTALDPAPAAPPTAPAAPPTAPAALPTASDAAPAPAAPPKAPDAAPAAAPAPPPVPPKSGGVRARAAPKAPANTAPKPTATAPRQTRATASKTAAALTGAPKANVPALPAVPKHKTAPSPPSPSQSDDGTDAEAMDVDEEEDAIGSTVSESDSESESGETKGAPSKKKPGPLSNSRLAIWMNDVNNFKTLMRRRAERWGCTEAYLINKAGVGQPASGRKRSPWNMYEVRWFAEHQDDESDRQTKLRKCRAAYDAECAAAKTPEQKRALVKKLTTFCIAYEDGLAKEEVERVGAQNALRKLVSGIEEYATPFYHRFGISIFGLAVSLRPGDIHAMAASCTFANNPFGRKLVEEQGTSLSATLGEIMQKQGHQLQKELDKDDFSPSAADRALAEAQTPRHNRLGHALQVLLARVNPSLNDAKRGVVLIYDYKLLAAGYRMIGWPTTVSTPMIIASTTGHFATDEVRTLIPLVYAALHWRPGQLPLPTLRLEKISQDQLDLKADPAQWGKVPVWVFDNGKVHRYVRHVLGDQPDACENPVVRPLKTKRGESAARGDSAAPADGTARKPGKRKGADVAPGTKEKKRRTAAKNTSDIDESALEKTDEGEKIDDDAMDIDTKGKGKQESLIAPESGSSVGSPPFTGNSMAFGVQDFSFPGNVLNPIGTPDVAVGGPSNVPSGSHTVFGIGQPGASSATNQMPGFQAQGPMAQTQWQTDNFMPYSVNDSLAPIVSQAAVNAGVNQGLGPNLNHVMPNLNQLGQNAFNPQLQQQIAQLVLNQVMATMGAGMWGQNGGNGMQ